MSEDESHVVDTAADAPGVLDTPQGRAELDEVIEEMHAMPSPDAEPVTRDDLERMKRNLDAMIADHEAARREPAHSLPVVILRKLLSRIGVAIDRWNARRLARICGSCGGCAGNLRPGAKPAEGETK